MIGADPTRYFSPERRARYEEFSAAMRPVQRFVRDPFPAVDSIAGDPTETYAARVLAWTKREAWGKYALYAIDDDGNPKTQEDCATDLGIDKRRVSDAVAYHVARGRMRPKTEVGKLMYPVIAPGDVDAPSLDQSGEKSGTYRTFLVVWRLAHSTEYAALEAAESTRKRIRTQVLCDFRTWKKVHSARTSSAAESADGAGSNPDYPDKKSATAADPSLLTKIPTDQEEESAGGRSSSIRESASAIAPLTARPPAPPMAEQTLKTWLMQQFRLPVAPDTKILRAILAHIPDEQAFARFQQAAKDARPKKWALLASIAAQCAARREHDEKVKPISSEERNRRTNEIMSRGAPIAPDDLAWLLEQYPEETRESLERIAADAMRAAAK